MLPYFFYIPDHFLADELWFVAKNVNLLVLNALFVVILFLCSFSCIELVYNADKMYTQLYQVEDKKGQTMEQDFTESNQQFVLKNSQEHEHILMLSIAKLQALYFGENKRISAFNPGIIDMFLQSDLVRFQNTIRDSSYNVFIEPEIFSYTFMYRSLATLTALYDCKTAVKSMVMLTKRKTKMPTLRFFGSTDQIAFHRKYNDDAAGLDERVNDAFGINPVELNPQFSVEALFYSQPQLYPYATVVGNMGDEAGFMLSNVFGSANFMFIHNSSAIEFPVPYYKWIYCVANVFPDHVDIYENGRFISNTKVPEPMRQSPEKLFIGNYRNPHYYLGGIAEVALVNKTLDSNTIKETWAQIKPTLPK